jgi:hypothetical protein
MNQNEPVAYFISLQTAIMYDCRDNVCCPVTAFCPFFKPDRSLKRWKDEGWKQKKPNNTTLTSQGDCGWKDARILARCMVVQRHIRCKISHRHLFFEEWKRNENASSKMRFLPGIKLDWLEIWRKDKCSNGRSARAACWKYCLQQNELGRLYAYFIWNPTAVITPVYRIW